ncbi:MAG: ATP-binding protein, partial [Pseudonocardia sp.]|nr:ATP-binding protein [Pseudonocardia sp.]
SVNAKALVFSVKGEDLLFLDRANTRLDDKQRERYRALGLPAEPFASAGFFAPPMPDDPAGRPHVTGRTSGVTPFWWTLAEFCRGELLPYAFADAEDERNQYTMVIHQVAAQLRREAVELDQGAVVLGGRTIRTYAQLVEFVSDKLNDEDERRDWAGPVTGTGTINAFLRRLRSSLKPLRTLLRGDLAEVAGRKVSTEGQQVTVVDLHNLPERAQRFVVGVVLAAETARKETAGTGGLLFTMIDELNKYAPREGSSPIKEVLLDIAERGRSRGIILIGAQQTASEVERRIVSNSSVKVVGRLDPAEAGRPEYGFLPPSQRARAVLAKPGAMFVSQPEIPVPLAVEFPFPAWATRLSEAGEEPVTAGYATGNGAVRRDPFAHLPAATEDDDAPVLLGGAQGRTRGPERDVRGAGGALQLGDPGQLGGGVRVGRFAVERGPQLGRATLRRGEGTGGLLLGAGGGRLLPAARGRGPVGLGERAVGRVTVAFRGFCGGAGRAGPGFPAGGLVPRPPGRRSTRGHCSRRGPTPDPACGGRSCSTSSWRACDGRLAAGRAQPG